jgi:hypothetical protein
VQGVPPGLATPQRVMSVDDLVIVEIPYMVLVLTSNSLRLLIFKKEGVAFSLTINYQALFHC